MADVRAAERCTNSLELVSAITSHVVPRGRPIEEEVLCKSVEECLFLSIMPDPLLDRSEFEIRLKHFLRKNGILALVRTFLSLHLFNVIWIQTERSFRMLAGTEASFQRYMKQVEQTCNRIVRETWKSLDTDSSSTNPIPQDLIDTIEKRLWEP
jgi:hypothetical protein